MTSVNNSRVNPSPTVTWHGTPEEWALLCGALQRFCTCTSIPQRWTICAGHRLMEEQRSLDHLVFAYRLRARLIEREWTCSSATDVRLTPHEWRRRG